MLKTWYARVMLRSRFLTHWSGRDIQCDTNLLTDANRAQYLDRTVDTVLHGMWMTDPEEWLHFWPPEGEDARIRFAALMTCFTELRLSGSAPHTRSYGLLGFVFTREFVLSRAGGPVHYVRSHRDDAVVGSIARVLLWVQRQRTRGSDAQGALDALNFAIGFTKGMSAPNSDDFAYLDEHEWRIIHSHAQERAGRIVPTGRGRPRYRIPFAASDLRMLIVPDSEVRSMVLKDQRLATWMSSAPPPILTADEVRDF
jgi:hypothetical protein